MGLTFVLTFPISVTETSKKTVYGCPLGRAPYEPAWTLQRKLRDRLLSARKHREQIPDFLLLVEHPPVYTMGKSGQDHHLLLDADQRSEQGIEYFEIGRGGDITFHGPGQLVAYFIIDLNRYYRDLHRFMRDLEEIVIRTLKSWDISGYRVPGRTGVWVGQTGEEEKICAFGIRCSRWITMHGLALNVNTDLTYYNHIIPCGIPDRGVTSMSAELNQAIDLAAVYRALCDNFGEVFGADVELLDESIGYRLLEEFTESCNLRALLKPEPFS